MTPTQPTFADLELQGARRKTRKAAFLEELDRAVPWGRLLALLAPAYPEGRRGRPPVGAEPMLRMYLLAVCYDLSDQAAEDEVADSAAARAFVGRAGADAPDATTLCRFRHLLEDNGLGEAVLAEVNAALAERGAAVSRGTIVDATFVEAPVSTKNGEGARDPEAHQGKKGNNWHFGYKAHIGVDADTGLVHTVDVTAANASDVARAFALVRPGDEEAWADSGYTGVARRPEVASDPALSRVVWHVAAKRSKVSEADRPFERALSSVRSRVEHPFHVVKDLFGIRKVRYRGLAKAAHLARVAFAMANLVLSRRAPRRCVAPHEALRAGA